MPTIRVDGFFFVNNEIAITRLGGFYCNKDDAR
jgi:hypothetical protein